MPKEKKEQIARRTEEFLSGCKIAIVTDYRGMSVAEMNQLRRRLKESGIEYHVVKNTLASLAAERTGKEGLKTLLRGPSAIVFGYSEVREPAKIVTEYIRSSKGALSIRGGLLGGRVLSSEEVATLSSLPSTEILLSRLAQQMQMPISSLLAVLSANLRGIVQILKAREQQLREN